MSPCSREPPAAPAACRHAAPQPCSPASRLSAHTGARSSGQGAVHPAHTAPPPAAGPQEENRTRRRAGARRYAALRLMAAGTQRQGLEPLCPPGYPHKGRGSDWPASSASRSRTERPQPCPWSTRAPDAGPGSGLRQASLNPGRGHSGPGGRQGAWAARVTPTERVSTLTFQSCTCTHSSELFRGKAAPSSRSGKRSVFTYKHTHVHQHTRVYTGTHTQVHTHACAHTRAHAQHRHTCAHTHTCTYLGTHVLIHTHTWERTVTAT